MKLLQFLSFIRNLEAFKQLVDDQVYYRIEFPVSDFLRFTGGNEKSQYQRIKALNFLKSLQEIKSPLQKFSDSEFRSSVMFPYLKLEKQGKTWIVKIAIGEELHFYNYPFIFSSSFLHYRNKCDLLVKLKLIESISTVGLEKKFYVKDFLNQFSLSNKDRTMIKKSIIDGFSILTDTKFIHPQFYLFIKSGRTKETNKLTTLLISQSYIIYFYETIDLNN